MTLVCSSRVALQLHPLARAVQQALAAEAAKAAGRSR